MYADLTKYKNHLSNTVEVQSMDYTRPVWWDLWGLD